MQAPTGSTRRSLPTASSSSAASLTISPLLTAPLSNQSSEASSRKPPRNIANRAFVPAHRPVPHPCDLLLSQGRQHKPDPDSYELLNGQSRTGVAEPRWMRRGFAI